MATKAQAQVTLTDITDAYTVYLTATSYTFPGTTTGAIAGSCTTQVVALLGPDQTTASVVESECTCPSGVSIASDDDPTSPTLTISVTAAVTQPGKVTIPVHVNGGAVEFTLEFAYGIAIRGQNGTSVTVTDTSVTYQVGTSGTAAPTGSWLDEPPTVPQGQYLWTRTQVTYSDGKSTTAYSVSRSAVDGEPGSDGTSVTVESQSVTYQASSSGTTPPSGTWQASVPTVPAGQFLWTRTVVEYSDGTSTTSYSVSRQGADGAAGADAITMVITSSAGTIFKNSNIDTVLTAHVYRAGAEVTGSQLTALGTIRWYKDGGSTAVATGASVEVTATDVVNTATYVAQLEG